MTKKNRCRKVERPKEDEASFGLRETYTQIEMYLPTQLRYSHII